jgi:hypothetical protein
LKIYQEARRSAEAAAKAAGQAAAKPAGQAPAPAATESCKTNPIFEPSPSVPVPSEAPATPETGGNGWPDSGAPGLQPPQPGQNDPA